MLESFASPPPFLTLNEVLRARAAQKPTERAITFLDDGETQESHLTYAQLDARARAVAAGLAPLLAQGQRVLLLYPPGLDYIAAFCGCLYAGAIAVPAYPPDPARLARTLPRLRAVVADAQATIALTTTPILQMAEFAFAQAPEMRALKWLATDAIPESEGAGWEAPAIEPEQLAFLQYTSGSTGNPKGVMLSHKNLLHNQRMIERGFEHGPNSVVVGWLPLYHDMGLIGNLMQPLFLGVPCVLLSPMAFLQRPLRWLMAISRYRATTSGGPNFSYDLCVRKTTPAERAALDLSSWDLAYCGAEPIRAETLRRFATTFAPQGFRWESFYPCYGLAESALIVSGGRKAAAPFVMKVSSPLLSRGEIVARSARDDGQELVGCGRAILDEEIAIVDGEKALRLGDDQVGEVWVASPSVAAGYFQKPEATAQIFGARLADGTGPYLRTGDLGFLHDGELFITGRAKDLIIIRGQNHYPQDIEATVERAHPALRPGCGAAFSIEVDGEEALVVAQEVDPKRLGDGAQVGAAIVQAIAVEHELHTHAVVLLAPGGVPKTSSGKIQRRACRQSFLDGTLEPLLVHRPSASATPAPAAAPAAAPAPADPAGRLVELVRRHLRLSSPPAGDAPLTRFGLDSLAALELKGELESELGLAIELSELLSATTDELRARQAASGTHATSPARATGRTPSITPAASGEPAPLSFAQESFWLLDQLERGQAIYNLAGAIRLTGRLDTRALAAALDALAARHEVLRTHFEAGARGLVQRVAPAGPRPLHLVSLAELQAKSRRAELERLATEQARRPFDLEKGPLFRQALVELADEEHVLLLTLHHAVADGRSLAILVRELAALDPAPGATPNQALAPVAMQYGEFARRQRMALTSDALAPHVAFFKERLAGCAPGIELPADRPRPEPPDYRGGTARRTLPKQTSRAVRELAAECGSTAYMVWVAAVNALFHRLTGEEDLLVGMPVLGRDRDTRELIGCFINTLVLRTDVSGRPSFRELVARVRAAALAAYAHQELPFEKLVEALRPQRIRGGNPFFEILLNSYTPPTLPQTLGGARAELVELGEVDAKLPLTLYLEEAPEELRIKLVYQRARYDEGRITAFLDQLVALTAQLVGAPDRPLGVHSLVTPAARALLPEPTAPLAQPEHELVPDVVAGWAARTGEAPALRQGGRVLRYDELVRAADELARALIAGGLRRGETVAVTGTRSFGLVAGMLGVLRSGGVLLTLDPALPEKRLTLMLEEARATRLVHAAPAGERPPTAAVVLRVDPSAASASESPPADLPLPRLTQRDPAYVFFTSGTTGRPKGVLGSHKGLAHFLAWQRATFSVAAGDRSAQLTGLSFDVVLRDVFLALTSGATLCLPEGGELGADLVLPWMQQEGITLLHAVPTLAQSWLASLPAGVVLDRLRWTFFAGEPLTDGLVSSWRAAFPSTKVANFYGPTETTLAKCFHVVGEPPLPGVQPVGRPLPETQALVLTPERTLAGIGEPGEIVIRTPFRSCGYLSPDEARRFSPNPFTDDPDDVVYATGDRGRYLPDGSLEILGRFDHQVKIRGMRVELGEIEAVLRQQPGVRAAVVDVRERERGGRLCAWVVADAGGLVSTDALREQLRHELPEHMVPSAFARLDALPLTSNGKVDRAALPDVAATLAEARAFAAPQTAIEVRLAALWAEALGVPAVGTGDDFFALGGHSLSAARLMARLRTTFAIELPLKALFDAPTIAQLARRIAAARPGAGDAALPQVVPDRAARHQPFPLNDIQRAYWVGRLGEMFALGNVAAHRYVEIDSAGMDLERFEAAWRRLIARHDMLRAVVSPDGEQRILAEVPPYQIHVDDLRALPPAEAEERVQATRRRMAHQMLPTDTWPLFEVVASRVAGERVRLHISFDLLISDARSFRLFLSELAHTYEHPDAATKPLELSFRDYVLAEQRLSQSDRAREAQAFWQARLPALPPAPELPLARDPSAVVQPRFVRRSTTLQRDAWDRLKRRAAQAGLTPSACLCAAFAEVLAAWSRSPRFTLNLTTFHRLPIHPEVDELLGDFTSLTLLAVDASPTGTFEERARRLQGELWEILEHHQVSGVALLRDLSRLKPEAAAGVLMPVVFTSALGVHVSSGEELLRALDATFVHGASQTPQVWLDHQVSEQDGALFLGWDAVEELFPAGMLDDMFEAYVSLLRRLAEGATAWSAQYLDLLPARQRETRERANRTDAPIPEGLVHTLFEERARGHPDAPAVIAGERTLSYQELSRKANQLARTLRAGGARPGTQVAIVMDKGWEQAAAALGVLVSGAAYLPLSPALPKERLWQLLERGEVQLALTQPRLDDTLAWPRGVRRIRVDEQPLAADDSPLAPLQKPEDLAYVLYTSGSTGAPKGVMIDHRGAVNTILDVNERFGVTARDRVLALSELSFDLSVYDLFGLFAAGGTVVMPDPAANRDPAHWAQLLSRNGVTIWNTVPALMQMLVEYAAERQEVVPRTLRLVLLSGDWIPVSLPDRIRELAPGAQLISLGGATEASIWSILHSIDEVDPTWRSVPYGKPMRNQRFHVLDDALEPRPEQVPGHLFIAGVGLAHGYFRDEERTRKSFFVHPRTGERLYRTGDLGCYLPNGSIEFLGRDDFQVKVQGHRIELGEIEATLLAHPAVRAALVEALGERGGERRLVAFVVPDQAAPPAEGDLRDFLAEKLPAYMVPGQFVRLAALPLTANGKIDRDALKSWREPPPASTPAGHALEDDALVARLAALVRTVLPNVELSPDVNLLYVGASSIDMVKISNLLEREFGRRPSLNEMFRKPTLAALAEHYAAHVKPPASAAPADSEAVLLDPAQRKAFQEAQHGLRTVPPGARVLGLGPRAGEGGDPFAERRTHRVFSTRAVKTAQLGALLSELRQVEQDGAPKYQYPSAGGLYPVQTYVYVKPERVLGVEPGLHYHHPVSNALVPLAPSLRLARELFGHMNLTIYDQAHFALFLVGKMSAIAPLYGPHARDFCLIEAGAMLQLLMASAPKVALGLCPVGAIDFARIRGAFELAPEDVCLHTLLGGVPGSAGEWEVGEL